MNPCEHETGDILHTSYFGTRITFQVIRCTYGCGEVFVTVTSNETQQTIGKLPTRIAPYATNKPSAGNAYYWRYEGLSHSTPPIAPRAEATP